MTADLPEQSFDPETLDAMGRAFATACACLGLAHTSDPRSGMIAGRIIDAAAAGERDADRLCEMVLTWARRPAA